MPDVSSNGKAGSSPRHDPTVCGLDSYGQLPLCPGCRHEGRSPLAETSKADDAAAVPELQRLLRGLAQHPKAARALLRILRRAAA
jgi:hypothetical protein